MSFFAVVKRDSLSRDAESLCEEETQKAPALPKPYSPPSIPPSSPLPRPAVLYPPLPTCDPRPLLLPYPGAFHLKLCPLVEVAKEFGLQVTQKRFSLIKLNRLNKTWESFLVTQMVTERPSSI